MIVEFHFLGKEYYNCVSAVEDAVEQAHREAVESARRETWLEAAKAADDRAKFLESVRTQSEGWFAISELKGIAAALRAKAVKP